MNIEISEWKPTLCIYHGNCIDGFTAAWVVDKWSIEAEQAVEYFAGYYGQPAPDCAGRDVIIVDFSYKRDELSKIVDECRSLIVLDHHKTAQEELGGFPRHHPIEVIFDMDRSGAGMTWDHFFPGIARPYVVGAVEDRDLWRFRLRGTKEINAVLSAHEMTFDNWNKVIDGNVEQMILAGETLLIKFNKDLAEQLKQGTMIRKVHGDDVPICNLHGLYSSEGGNAMCKSSGAAFSVTWFDTKEHRKFSLRSTDEGRDVSAIAKEYGGGGHRNAAGFSLSHGEWPRS